MPSKVGIQFYNIGEFDKALPHLQYGVDDEPNNDRSQYALGACLYQLSRFTEAEPYLQRAVELNQSEENYCYLLGCCLCQLNRFTEAEPHLQRAVELKPGDNRDNGSTNKVWLQYCLEKLGQSLTKSADQRSKIVENNVGIQFYNIGEFDKALPHLQYGVDVEPNNDRSQYVLGDCLYQLSRFTEAEPHLQRAVELNQSEENYCYLLGCCLCQLNRFTEAEPHLQRAIELKPDDGRSEHTSNKAWLMRSLQRRKMEVFRNLVSRWSHRSENTVEVIEDRLDPYEIGIQYFNEQRYRESQTFFQRILDKSPTHIESQYCLGVSLSKLLRHADAEPYFRNLVESAPDKEEYRYWRGSNLVQLIRYNEAEPHLQRAVDLKPDDDRGAGTTNRDWLNKCQSNLPHRVTVADIFEEALARNSGDSVAFGDLGVTRLYQNRFAEALALFREALRLSPADFYKIQIVECYERLGNTELAQQMRLEYPDFFEVNTPEPDQELLNPPTFSEFLTNGSTWLDGAGWENRQLSPLLKSLHQQNAKWADPTKVLFTKYDIAEDDLAETLARAESLQQHLHLETEMPVYLQTKWVSIAMTIENGWIRAWVGIGLEGCAVSLNPSTWDLQFLNGDRDALFAAAAAVNWYIDCSIILTAHPKFRKESEDRRDDVRPWPSSANGWSATSLFSDDVDDIRKGRQAAPSRAHRVRGHTRSLTQGEPTDDARAKAPAHIRAFMGPNDTWVQAHTRGGETETQNLLNRLHKHSSLADFLATAQLDLD